VHDLSLHIDDNALVKVNPRLPQAGDYGGIAKAFSGFSEIKRHWGTGWNAVFTCSACVTGALDLNWEDWELIHFTFPRWRFQQVARWELNVIWIQLICILN
jgi:hypothetical protein